MNHTVTMNHTRVSASSVLISWCPNPVRADKVLIRWVCRLWCALSSLWRQKTATSSIRNPSNMATPLVIETFIIVFTESFTYVASALELLWALGPRIPGDNSTGGTTPALHITQREWLYKKKMDTENGGCWVEVWGRLLWLVVSLGCHQCILGCWGYIHCQECSLSPPHNYSYNVTGGYRCLSEILVCCQGRCRSGNSNLSELLRRLSAGGIRSELKPITGSQNLE